jgi:hypothetical protein
MVVREKGIFHLYREDGTITSSSNEEQEAFLKCVVIVNAFKFFRNAFVINLSIVSLIVWIISTIFLYA